MSDRPDVTNAVQPGGPARSTEAGDVPDALRRRYLTEAGRNGAGIAYYVDATVVIPSFRDRGGQLIATRSDPNTVRDLVSIAQHRGWAAVQVSGASGFRREAWLAGRIAGLEVDGYRPGERDLQVLQRRVDARVRHPAPERETPDTVEAERRRRSPSAPSPRDRQRIVEAVARSRVADPAIRDRILAAARSRLAQLLDREEISRFHPRTVERSRNR